MKILIQIFYFILMLAMLWVGYMAWLLFSSIDVNPTANSITEFRKEIDATLFNVEDECIFVYENNGTFKDIILNPKYSPKLWESIKSFEDFETNALKRELKEKFESLLVMYLDIDNLFSISEIEKAYAPELPDNSIGGYIPFYGVQSIYIKYLQENPSSEHEKLLYKIVDKNLKNFHELAKNSNTFFDYFTSILYMKNQIFISKCSPEIKNIFKKYPPLKSELFFEKLKLHKKYAFKILAMLRAKKMKQNFFQKSILDIYVSNIFDEIYKRETLAIRDGSDEAIAKFKAYMEAIEIDSKEWDELVDLTVWIKPKKKSKNSFRKVIYLLVSATIMEHDDFDIYEDHKLLELEYEKFLNGCVE